MSSKIDVIFPTRGRAQVLEDLVANLAETAGEQTAPMFVVDPDDDATWLTLEVCWADYEGWVLALELMGGYPQKANAGAKASNALSGGEFVMIGGDDVRFHDGWADCALDAFRDPRLMVVAPNDMSPNAGNNATFPIVRRSYIEDPGASWDGPGTLYHDGYVHNFSDTELWTLALKRMVGRYIPECRVEHMHPAWGKAEVDETYRSGGLNSKGWAEDEQRFILRSKEWER
jgi:hypothetical protein